MERDIKAGLEICAKATKRPWFAVQYAYNWNLQTNDTYAESDNLLDENDFLNASNNAELIIMACNNIEEYITELQKTREENKKSQEYMALYPPVKIVAAEEQNTRLIQATKNQAKTIMTLMDVYYAVDGWFEAGQTENAPEAWKELNKAFKNARSALVGDKP